MNSRTLALVISAYNKSKPAFRAVRTGLKRVGKVSKTVVRALKAGWKAVGKAISVATGFIKTAIKLAIIPLTLLTVGFGVAVREAAGFEQQMANVASVLGSTGKELDSLSRAAREMGKVSVFTARDAASAMYDLASAGFNADQVIGALKGTMLLAAATASDLTFTTETMTATIKQFSLQAEDADRVANAFAATISFSKMNMDRLATSMSYAGPIASGFGHSLEGTLSVLAQFANMGLRASQIGTTFRMGLLQLQRAMPVAEIEKGADVLKRLGITFKDIDPSLHSVADIVEQLHGKVTKMSEAVALFGVRAGGPFLKLIKGGAAPLREFEKKITGTRKAFQMSQIQLATFYGSLRLFKSAIQELSISFGTAFLPVLTKIVNQFSDWTNIVNTIDWSGVWKGFAEGTETGVKAFDKIIAMFREGGAFRKAIVEWMQFFSRAIGDLAAIVWRPLATELKVVFMEIVNTISTEIDKLRNKILSVTKITKWLPPLAPASLAAEKAVKGMGGVSERTGERAQKAFRATEGAEFKQDIDKLMATFTIGLKPAVSRTTEALNAFTNVVERVDPSKRGKAPWEIADPAAPKVKDSSDKMVELMQSYIEINEKALSKVDDNQRQLRTYLSRKIEIMQRKMNEWKMKQTSGVSQVGALS